MIRVAVVEDNVIYADMFKKKILETDFKDKTIVDIYLSPINFLNNLEADKYQLCFSDIKMPELDGVEMADKIRNKDSRLLLVFVSSYPEYATEGYRVKAFDYFTKDQLDRGWDALTGRILNQLEDNRKKIYKIIRQSSVEIIPINLIVYIYKEGKYCIFVVDGREKATIRKPIKDIGTELQGYKNFILVKRGYIINMEKIRKYSAEKVVMENGDELKIGKAHVARVKELVMRYVEEM